MTTFISASEVLPKSEKRRPEKIEAFISAFNKAIKKGEFAVNESLDKLPILNNKEFFYCVEQARLQGWKLTRFDDNYQTLSYKVDKLTA